MPIDPMLSAMLEYAPLLPEVVTRETIMEFKQMDLSMMPPEEMRVQVQSVENRVIEGPNGDIAIRIYSPESSSHTLPAILYFHGGGFCIGSIELFDMVCRQLCKETNAKVISVEYRLAPECPFPQGPEDCYAALEWVSKNSKELGIDPDNINVCGDSAGGNFSAVLPLMTRDRKGPPISHQILLYPGVDFPPEHVENSPYESMRTHVNTPVLASKNIRCFYDFYVEKPEDRDNPYVAPIKASDLSGLPPAMVVTAEYCPLRDEGEAYAEKLKAHGVDVELIRCAGMTHAFFSFPLPVVDELMQKIAEFIAK